MDLRKHRKSNDALKHYQAVDADGFIVNLLDLSVDDLRNELAHAYDLLEKLDDPDLKLSELSYIIGAVREFMDPV